MKRIVLITASVARLRGAVGFVAYPLASRAPNFVFRAVPQSWGVDDRWDSLSGEGGTYHGDLTSPEDFEDPVGKAVRMIEHQDVDSQESTYSKDDVDEAVDAIQFFHGDESDPPLYDTRESLDDFVHSDQFEALAEKEINLLVRCNQSPETILVSEGRAILPLTAEQKREVKQLVTFSDSSFTFTPFFYRAVAAIFKIHAKDVKGVMALDGHGIAAWMTISLKEGQVSKHDWRIRKVISKYSTYGTGYLELSQFEEVYKGTLLQGFDAKNGRLRPVAKGKVDMVKSVWRDFEQHGIKSPNVEAWEQQSKKLERLQQQQSFGRTGTTMATGGSSTLDFDECEILDWQDENATPHWSIDSQGVENQRKSSHESVELCKDEKTPRRMKDGEFVFIDEESCIGCVQCATVAPSSFIMLDTGRARTFKQSNSEDVKVAVSTCPVSCMKHVSFDELKEMEGSRDKGDGRNDHRHMNGHTPLYVVNSDAQHKSSWYHYLKQKCYMSHKCPQKGCYDCPLYSQKGQNPFFQQKQAEATKARFEHIVDTGEADRFRKSAEL